jgi:hypothetical protein
MSAHKKNEAAQKKRLRYKAEGRREKNKLRKQAKHKKLHPNDHTL